MSTEKKIGANKPLDKVITHLEYLGYEIEEKKADVISASHERLANLCVENKTGGFFFFTWLKGNELAETHRAEFLECLNRLNSKSFVLRFHADEDGDTMLEAWYPKPYNRAGFASFMDLLCRDFQLMSSDDCDARKFCC